ncbi:MAG: hypothetical protein R3F43_06935 [bacterium]
MRVGTRLAQGLGVAARVLAELGDQVPRRLVGRSLGRLRRLLEVGAALPAHQQRPSAAPRAMVRSRSPRGPRRSPLQRQTATGRG